MVVKKGNILELRVSNGSLLMMLVVGLMVIILLSTSFSPVALSSENSNGGIKALFQDSSPSPQIIHSGTSPEGIILDNSNGLIYVANWGSCNITVVNSKNNTVVGSINNLPSKPRVLAIDTITNQLLVTDVGVPADGISGQFLTVIALSNNTVVQNIDLGGSPWGVAFDPHNGMVYVSDVNEGLIILQSYYNSVTGEYNFKSIDTINVGFWPENVLYDPVNYNIYVAVTGPGPSPGATNYIAVINTTNQSVMADVPVTGNPESLAFDSQNNYVYAGVFEDEIYVINGTDNKVIRSVNSGTGFFLEYIPDGNYILTDNNSTVEVLNASNAEVIRQIGGVSGASGSLYDQMNGLIYIASSNNNEVVYVEGFSVERYEVNFKENGLPSGTVWYVNLSNGQSLSSNTSTITFYEQNGSYLYTVSTSDKVYAPAAYSGSFNVDGNAVSESITFSRVIYKVIFTESGLPSGTMWNVTIDGKIISSINSTITFSNSNETYSYMVGNVSGYVITNYTVSMKSNPYTIYINTTFFPVNHKTSVISSFDLYSAIAILSVMTIVSVSVAISLKRKI